MTQFSSIIAIDDLSRTDKDEMFALMSRHYINVIREEFDRDLSEKRWVIVSRSEEKGHLCGFTTQMLLSVKAEGRSVSALFSGDTIVDRKSWGEQALLKSACKLAISLCDERPQEELYWFLVSAGFRTYRLLPLFFLEFFPRFDRKTPEGLQRIVEVLGKLKFARRFDSTAGVVKAHSRQYYLRPEIGEVPAARLRDPHVSFFVGANPGHCRGDELCCLARLSRSNFTHAAYRLLESHR